MNSFTKTHRKRETHDRVAYIKARLNLGDVIMALNCDEEGPECPSPRCGSRSLKACAGDRGFYCDVCGETGDIIDLVRATKNIGHLDALDFLEAIAPRCARTGDLFAHEKRRR